ncbi:GTP-binding protein, partial [Clostridium sp. HCS.1]|uniref:GTP-binding protein n=1 Tax=Clostridium sp. HCS.1 TaxID=3238594 RepID=UPI003A0FEF83
HIDFSSEMERALSILDYAILIVSGVEGIQGHTETIWTLLKKYNVPTFFFINKMDRIGANLEKIIEEIKENLTSDICFIDNLNELNEEIIEFVSERDESL